MGNTNKWYDEGYSYAFREDVKNKSRKDCPYPSGTENHKWWVKGFGNGKHDRQQPT